jgi:hypothetical protein
VAIRPRAGPTVRLSLDDRNLYRRHHAEADRAALKIGSHVVVDVISTAPNGGRRGSRSSAADAAFTAWWWWATRVI